MSNVTLLAVDLAKNVFQLHGTDANGKTIVKKRLSRDKLLSFVANLDPCNIYMEGCGSANYWGREFKKFGHQVKLINPKYVKPYVKRNKNDKNDAIAIASAARDPSMRFGEVKTKEQQDIQSTHRIRSNLIRQRTALANQVRGLLAEYGIIIPKGIEHVREHLPLILDNNGNNLSELMLTNIQELYESLVQLDQKIDKYETIINNIFKNNEVCKRLYEIPGVGEISATILSGVLGNNGADFKNGRHFAAFLGLTPREHSSGDKTRLCGISKKGDAYIRTILIHGARAVLRFAGKKKDKKSIWLKRLVYLKGENVAAVALANKNARTAWALVHGSCDYNPNHKPTLFNDLTGAQPQTPEYLEA
jgi:transposase